MKPRGPSNFSFSTPIGNPKKDLSITSSKIKKFLGWAVPKIVELRKFHKHHKVVKMTVSNACRFPLCKERESDYDRSCSIVENWGDWTPHQTATRIHISINWLEWRKRWSMDSTVLEQIGQRIESIVIPRRERFSLVGILRNCNLQIKIFTLIGIQLFKCVSGPPECNMWLSKKPLREETE